jgi:hypothetical protein
LLFLGNNDNNNINGNNNINNNGRFVGIVRPKNAAGATFSLLP